MYSFKPVRSNPNSENEPAADPVTAQPQVAASTQANPDGFRKTMDALQRAEDNGYGRRKPAKGNVLQAAMDPALQMKSSVACKTANYSYDSGNKVETVGASMIALLDPNDPINGSAPGDGEQKGLMDYMRDTKDFRSMKRGHLMNGQLGGVGIAANLFPITTQANNWHQKHVENYVKQALANGVGLMYTVSVDSGYDADSGDSAKAVLNCNSTVWDPNGDFLDLTEDEPFTQVQITSQPNAGDTGSASINASVNPKLTFLTKNLPHGWGEKKKGLKEWNDNVPGHFSSN